MQSQKVFFATELMLPSCSALLRESLASFRSEFGDRMPPLGPFEVTRISHNLHKKIAH